jgi:hypothetical protein
MNVSAVGAATRQVQTTQVSPAVLKAATGDGDGRTGVAALNDGDAAAQRAATQASHAGKVDVRA